MVEDAIAVMTIVVAGVVATAMTIVVAGVVAVAVASEAAEMTAVLLLGGSGAEMIPVTLSVVLVDKEVAAAEELATILLDLIAVTIRVTIATIVMHLQLAKAKSAPVQSALVRNLATAAAMFHRKAGQSRLLKKQLLMLSRL
jgi:hypothetical protein